MLSGDSWSRLNAIKKPHYIVVETGKVFNVSFSTYEQALRFAKIEYEKIRGGWFWIYKAKGVVRPTDGSGSDARHDKIKEEIVCKNP